jgi:type VI protein secretion system component VasF
MRNPQDILWLQVSMGLITLAFSIYFLIFYTGKFKFALFVALFVLSLGFLGRYRNLKK